MEKININFTAPVPTPTCGEKTVPTNFRIAIRAIPIGGAGDYAGAAKIQTYVREVFKGRISPENIKIFMKAEERKAALFPRTVFHPKSEARKFDPDMVISFPGSMDKNHNFQKKYLARRVPTMYWTEYGVEPMQYSYVVGGKEVKERSEILMSGLNDKKEGPHDSIDEKGIFLDRELVEWSSKERRAKERLLQLESCSEGLQKAILGDKFSKKSIGNFSDKQRLFVGYTNEHQVDRGEGCPAAVQYLLGLSSMNRDGKRTVMQKIQFIFLSIITFSIYYFMKRSEKIRTKEKDMTVFLMGNHDLTEYNQSKQEHRTGSLENENVKKHFYNCGISKIEIFEYNKDTGKLEITKTISTVTNRYEDKDKKQNFQTMRIITGSIPHREAIQLMKAAEDETVVTGDGSLAEAISARKSFMYQKPVHKRNLGEGLEKRYEGIPAGYVGNTPQFEDGELDDKGGDYFIRNRISKGHRRAGDDVIRDFDLEKNARPKLEAYVEKLQEEKREHGATIGYDIPEKDVDENSGDSSEGYGSGGYGSGRYGSGRYGSGGYGSGGYGSDGSGYDD